VLAIGLFAWSIGHFAAFAVFRHAQPTAAISVAGVLLVGHIALVEISARPAEHLSNLVLFSGAALALLARTHARTTHARWIRRRMADPGTPTGPSPIGGPAFASLAIVAALALTVVASVAPLGGAWAGVASRLADVGQELQQLLPNVGSGAGIGFPFGRRMSIGTQWLPQGLPIATVRLEPGEREALYWKVVAYDRFEFPNAWSWSMPNEVEQPADRSLLAGAAADPGQPNPRREVSFTVVPERGSPFALSPQDADRFGQDTRVVRVGETGSVAAVLLSQSGDPYAGAALLPLFGDAVPGGITGSRLRAASEGRDYPTEVRSTYIDQIAEGAIGPRATALLDEIRGRAGSNNPYDLAVAAEAHLAAVGEFDADIGDLPGCAELGTVECFATYKRGFCRHYATTMALLLRQAGVPTRVVEGFLPVPPSRTGEVRLTSSEAHAWTEVWFPEYGWIRFDPTGGGVGQPSDIVEGSPVPSAAASIDPSFRLPTDRPQPSAGIGVGGADPPGAARGGTSAAVLAVVFLLAAAVPLFLVARRRRRRTNPTPDTVWWSVVRRAQRAGLGPRPDQTAYEYAGDLGSALSASRGDIEMVARARVEAAYGRRRLDDERLVALGQAGDRLRTALLRRALHRPAAWARDRLGRRPAESP
jgi:transglutaminase-like putative cysteine protease